MKSDQSILSSKHIFKVIGFALLTVFSFLYCVLIRKFAELHLQLPFLDFPIFVGEWLLLVCVILLVCYWKVNNVKFNKWHLIIGLYIFWITVKAFHGYLTWGPLAFRNAALFYYSLFAVLSYFFFDKKYFSPKVVYSALVFLLCVFYFAHYGIVSYLRFASLMIFFTLLIHVRNIWLKSIFLIFLLFSYPFNTLIQTPRSLILGFLAAMAFLIFIYFAFFLKISKTKKAGLLVIVIGSVIAMLTYFGEAQRIQSFKTFGNIREIYKERLEEMKEKEGHFEFREIEPKIFHDEKIGVSSVVVDFTIDNLVETSQIWNVHGVIKGDRTVEEVEGIKDIKKEERERVMNLMSEMIRPKFEKASIEFSKIVEKYVKAIKKKEMSAEEARIAAHNEIGTRIDSYADKIAEEYKIIMLNEMIIEDHSQKKKIFERKIQLFKENTRGKLLSIGNYGISQNILPVITRSLDTEHHNVLFRLFIWRDMIREMKENRAFFGINFGKPQRSKTIEMLGYAKEEWLRDGWITPHNSFLHMIYRGGIVGIVLVVCFFFSLYKLTISFIKCQSFSGILLVSAFIFWSVISNFLVILELPYNAIPIWSLFGMTIAYSHTFKSNIEQKSENV